MASLGKTIKKSFERGSISSTLVGILASTLTTIAPMLLIMGGIILLYVLLGYNSVVYSERVLFTCSILYIFIFSLVCTSPYNPVISRYITDKIFEEKYDAILPCYYGGLFVNLLTCCIVGIPFYLYSYLVGGIDPAYTLTCYVTFIALSTTFYSMIYLSITKDYAKISLFFTLGAVVMILVALIATKLLHFSVSYSMLLGVGCCFLTISISEFAYIKGYFHNSDESYFGFMSYFKPHWRLAATNFLYFMGLYIHNFIFWTMPDRIFVKDTYICYPPYDMATCIAMFTNISASVILITQIELHFHERYKAYSEAVIGGRLSDINKAKNRMFSLLSYQLMDVVRNQFIISVLLYLFCVVFLPQFGFAGLVMKIYPCLAAGYFVIFLLYSCIIFLFYFNDELGALLTTLALVTITGVVSFFARDFPPMWYGIGTFLGSFAGWVIAYFRLRWVERNIDEHIFCKGELVPSTREAMPTSVVFPVDITETSQAEGKA